MKRLRHLLWGLLAFSCTTTDMEPTLSVAQPDRDTPSVKYLSPKEAGNIATAFMASLDGDGERSRGDKTRKVSEVSLLNSKTITRSAETDTTFYVVNFEEGGYSLIAADRELDNNVYVYSPDGEFSSDDNPVLDIYLENAIATMPDAPRRGEIGNMAKMSRANVPCDPELPAQGEVLIFGEWYVYYIKSWHSVKKPLLTTQWGQGSPYNAKCFTDDGKSALAGCVPIAIGQICYYNKWPERIDNHVFDWNNIKENDGTNSDIATLIHDIGTHVKVKYNTDGSSAQWSNIFPGIKKIGYSSAIAKDFSALDCMYSLNGDHPVYMQGTKPSTNVGHAWVVDGYDNYSSQTEYYHKETGELYMIEAGVGGYTYLHFNTGWHGEGNAYYLCYGQGVVGTEYRDFLAFNYTSNCKIVTGMTK